MNKNLPLAERMRPSTLNQYIGQAHLMAKGKVLYQLFESKRIHSMLFWGPPGVGKTTLARLICNHLELPFYSLSAINSGVADVRNVILEAGKHNGAVLFIDEIHRFNKSQQDSLLGAVENGTIFLIGATTENPSFEVISPLLSRCQVYILNHLSVQELNELLQQAIQNDSFLKSKKINLIETDAIIAFSGGDARKCLNYLEIIVQYLNSDTIEITNAISMSVLQKKMAMFDKNGDQHYDIISAFIKSIRGSDPNAALYYLARMIEGGEDPKFIVRRLLILASEDIGNSNPTALVMANNAFQAVQVIGYPECRIILSQITIYLACSTKSNASYTAIEDALRLVKKTGDLPVPLALRNAPTKLMKDLNYGEEYAYSHNYQNNFIDQEFLPPSLSNTTLFKPGNNARENEMSVFLKQRWKEKYGY
jgi:putative ATPase